MIHFYNLFSFAGESGRDKCLDIKSSNGENQGEIFWHVDVKSLVASSKFDFYHLIQ